MSHSKRTNPDFLNGVPELVMLQLLARQPMYGYELVQAIKRTTCDRLDFGEGCIYPILHRLEREGLLASRRDEIGGRSRIVYRLTAKGQRRLTESAALWRQIADAIGLVLQGGVDARPTVA
jgi:PadR family transcriptional regulator